MREVEGRTIVQGKLFAELDVPGVDDLDLVGDVLKLVIDFDIIDVDLFVLDVLVH